MAEPTDLPFGFWTWAGQSKHKFKRTRYVAPMCNHGSRHLAITIELSVYSSDAPYVKLL